MKNQLPNPAHVEAYTDPDGTKSFVVRDSDGKVIKEFETWTYAEAFKDGWNAADADRCKPADIFNAKNV